jgi:glycine/D-amino acid oxidase-like deaminating enzyme
MARNGTRVTLLERARLGSGATGRNAGFLLAGVASSYAAAAARYGRDRAAEIWQFTLDNHRLTREVVEGSAAAYRCRGSWLLPATSAERAQLLESSALLAEDGLPGEWHDAAPASGEALGGGLYTPTDGEMDPLGALAALASGLPAGAVCTGVEVLALEPSNGAVRVHLVDGELEAGRVVLATNGYSRRLLPHLPVAPVRAQMLATGPVGVVTAAPVYSDFGYRYWRQLADGRVLLGGFRNSAFAEEVGDDDRPTDALQSRLTAHLGAIGAGAAVTHRWAGTMGFTPDELPMVGAVPGQPNVYVCGGYSGHGLGFALHCAEVLVASWRGGAIPRWLDAARFAADRPGAGL